MMLTTCLSLLLLVVLPARAQLLIDTSRDAGRQAATSIDKAFASPKQRDSLACSVDKLKPILNFALRYQAGYRLRFPLSQFPPGETDLRVILRVTDSAKGASNYFLQDLQLPDTPRGKGASGWTGGGFFLGEGSYVVDWLMVDSEGRKCREQWNLKLRLKNDERGIVRFLKPGEVTSLVLDPWEGRSESSARSFRVSVILHTSPLSPRSVRLSGFDRSILLSTITSLLEAESFEESSVHAISLQRQEKIFDAEEFTAEEYTRLSNAMRALELGTIDVGQLSNPDGHVDLLAELVNREMAAGDPPDAIIFIGPNTRHTTKFPPERLESIPGKKPLFFYVNLDYYPRRFPFSDTIEKLVKGQKGKVFNIHHPKQFAEALQFMEDRLAESAEKPVR